MPTLDELESLLDQLESSPPPAAPADAGTPASSATQLPALVIEGEPEPAPAAAQPQPQPQPGEGQGDFGSLDELEQFLEAVPEQPQQPQGTAPAAGSTEGQPGVATSPDRGRESGVFGRLGDAALRGGFDVTEGFYRGVANLIGFPVEVVNEALGKAGLEFLEHPGDAQKAVRNAFRKAGLRVREGDAERFMQRVGDETLPTLLGIAGLLGMAQKMAAVATGPGLTFFQRLQDSAATLVREMGLFAAEHPAATTLGGLATIPGMVAGGDVGGAGGEGVGRSLGGETGAKVGRAIGETVGAVVGGGLTSMPATIGVRRPRLQRTPIAEQTADINQPRYFAETQLAAQRRAIDDAISAALHEIAPAHAANPQRASTLIVDRLMAVRNEARLIENRLWNRVPRDVEADISNVLPVVDRQLELIDVNPSMVPGDWLTRIRRLAEDSNRVITTGDLIEMRKGLRDARWAAGASTDLGPAAKRELRARLGELEEAIIQSIDNALGGSNVAWLQARQYSKLLNDRFTRGEVGHLLNMTAQATTRVHPEDALNSLLNRERGIRAIAEAADLISAPAGAGRVRLRGARELLDQVEESVKEELTAEVENVMRMADAARPGSGTRAGAESAVAWLNKHRGRLDPIIRLGRDTEVLRINLENALRRHAEIDGSILAQVVEADPTNYVGRLFNHINPRLAAQRLMRELKRDVPIKGTEAHAVAGLKRGIIDYLLNRSGGSMVKMQELILNKAHRGLLEEVWGSDHDRFERLINSAAAIERGDIRTTRGAVTKAGTWLAHIVGLHLGRAVAKVTSAGQAGSLSLPFRVAAGARNWVINKFGSVSENLFKQALVDPDMEDVLLSRIPGSEHEMRLFNTRMKRLVRRMNTGRYAADRLLETFAAGSEDDDAANRK